MAKELLVSAHGGRLEPLMVKNEELKNSLIKESGSYNKIELDSKELSDVIMLGTGLFSPLKGFMVKKDYINVIDNMHLSNGVLWSMPVTLAVGEEESKNIKLGSKVGLYNVERKEIVAILDVMDIYKYDRGKEAIKVFGTNDINHPGVNKIYEQGDTYIGGEVIVLNDAGYGEEYPEFLYPEDTRKVFIDRGWRTITAFQTRNPLHRSHEYLTKIALEVSDGLFLNPIVGKLKEGDIPADVRMECYKILIENYYPKDRVLLSVYPMEMRYAGPKEAILHAIIRQNFGCTHIIIGRDHAGVGNYYGPFDAQKIFDDLEKNELLIKPLKLDHTFWCYKCDSMASLKTCPHQKEDRLLISGTNLRKMLSEGKMPPKEFSRPEVLEILQDYYKKISS